MRPSDFNILEYFRFCLLNRRRFVFTRMGDGEIACMRGEVGQNCDGVRYSPELATDLHAAFYYLGKTGAFIGHWEHAQPPVHMPDGRVEHYAPPDDYTADTLAWEQLWGCRPWCAANAVLHRVDQPLEPVVEFWKTLSLDRRPKVLVGPRFLSELAPAFGFDSMYCVHGWEAYADIQRAREHVTAVTGHRDAVVVVSAGLAAKVLTHLVVRDCPRATVIDAGSSFDPLFGRKTRTGQPDGVAFADLYLK